MTLSRLLDLLPSRQAARRHALTRRVFAVALADLRGRLAAARGG